MNAKNYGLDEALVYAVIRTESNFNEEVRSPKGAVGLMQIMPQTADWCAREMKMEDYSAEKLLLPSINVEIGCWYLGKLVKQYGNIDTAVAAYNAGSGNVAKWLADSRYSVDGRVLRKIPFTETESYVKKINTRHRFYVVLLEIYDFLGSKYYHIFVEQ